MSDDLLVMPLFSFCRCGLPAGRGVFERRMIGKLSR